MSSEAKGIRRSSFGTPRAIMQVIELPRETSRFDSGLPTGHERATIK
jgi:hypothetical protein